MQAQLIPVDGSPPVAITRDLTLVGRNHDCDLCLNHRSVSKLHCVIVKTDGLLILRDLGSTNGTRVNGQRVRRAALLPNDQLGIAVFKFLVHIGPEPAEQDPTLRLELERAGAGAAAAGERPPKPTESAFPPPVQSNALPDAYPDEPAGR
jgi:pSer/pThr/pTyr-binding forkhead associated (FHA) protein